MSVNHTITKKTQKTKKKKTLQTQILLRNKLIHFVGDPFTRYKLQNRAYSYIPGNIAGDTGHTCTLHQNVVWNKAKFATDQYFRNLDEGKIWEIKKSLDFIAQQISI